MFKFDQNRISEGYTTYHNLKQAAVRCEGLYGKSVKGYGFYARSL